MSFKALLSSSLAPLALAGVLQQSDFSSGSISPFSACNVKAPSHVTPESGSLTVFFDEANFDGTRDDRGAEFCVFESGTRTNVKQMAKEGWQGFRVYIPSSSASEPFPDDKNTIIAQQFCPGGCSSWCGTVEISDNTLVADYRPTCGAATRVTLVEDIARDKWHNIVIRMRVSREQDGAYEVWYDGEQVHSAKGINVGFGTWDGDKLATGWYFKNGMYAWEDPAYDDATRTLLFDDVKWYETDSGETNGYDTVAPPRSKC